MKDLTDRDTFNAATAQEVFDFVAHHLLTQNERSVSPLGAECAYRGQNGLKCAAGCLIPDEIYDEDLEGQLWCNIKDIVDMKQHAYLVTKLQYIHDEKDVNCWKHELTFLANRLALSTVVMELVTR